jgi:protein-arginine kinase
MVVDSGYLTERFLGILREEASEEQRQHLSAMSRVQIAAIVQPILDEHHRAMQAVLLATQEMPFPQQETERTMAQVSLNEEVAEAVRAAAWGWMAELERV